MQGSSSAPVLMKDSPYSQVIGKGTKPKKRTAWHPPPGAFNNPELPSFASPGPGRYTPSVNFVKPRQGGTRFGSEDRFKYLGPRSRSR